MNKAASPSEEGANYAQSACYEGQVVNIWHAPGFKPPRTSHTQHHRSLDLAAHFDSTSVEAALVCASGLLLCLPEGSYATL